MIGYRAITEANSFLIFIFGNMLRAENITKSYGNLKVLKGVSLNIEKGEVVSIVGSSGAGKSTLLHILGTLDKPDSGDIFIDGKQVNKLSKGNIAKFRNQNIGFIFQFHHLLPEFSALENVSIPGWIAKKNSAEVKRRALELLDFLGLKDRINNKPQQLSGGEQQRVAVARALINSPTIIMADEPTGNLDSENASNLHNLFISLRDNFNQAFLIVTHNEELATMSNKILHMKDGQIV